MCIYKYEQNPVANSLFSIILSLHHNNSYTKQVNDLSLLALQIGVRVYYLNNFRLYQMLYDDNETRFKGAKLVLTPNKDSTSATTPITPVTPSKTMKKATIVRDDEPSKYQMGLLIYWLTFLISVIMLRSSIAGCLG